MSSKFLIIFYLIFAVIYKSNSYKIFTNDENKKFLIERNSITFERARNLCDTYNMELLIIMNQENQNKAIEYMKIFDLISMWIDANDDKVPGVYRWGKSDSKVEGFTNWGMNRPNREIGRNKAIYIFKGSNYAWFDAFKTSRASALCFEKELEINDDDDVDDEQQTEKIIDDIELINLKSGFNYSIVSNGNNNVILNVVCNCSDSN